MEAIPNNGLYGHGYFTSSAAPESGATFCAIQVTAAAVVTYKSHRLNSATNDAHTTVTLPAGTIVVGRISELSVTSGTVIGYFFGEQ